MRKDAVVKMGISVEMRITSALSVLAYGGKCDETDEIVKFLRPSIRLTLIEFRRDVVNVFDAQ